MHYADLSRPDEIRRLADVLLKTASRINALVNKAGAVFANRDTTPDGLELTVVTGSKWPTSLEVLITRKTPDGIYAVVDALHDLRSVQLGFANADAAEKFNEEFY